MEQFEDRVLNKRAAQVWISSFFCTIILIYATPQSNWYLLKSLVRLLRLAGWLSWSDLECLFSVALSIKAEDGGDPSSWVHLHHQVWYLGWYPIYILSKIANPIHLKCHFFKLYLSQEERYKKNCCPEVLLSFGPAKGYNYTLVWSLCQIRPLLWPIIYVSLR